VWVQFAHFKKKKSLYFKVFGTLTDKVRKIEKYSKKKRIFLKHIEYIKYNIIIL